MQINKLIGCYSRSGEKTRDFQDTNYNNLASTLEKYMQSLITIEGARGLFELNINSSLC